MTRAERLLRAVEKLVAREASMLNGAAAEPQHYRIDIWRNRGKTEAKLSVETEPVQV